MPIRNAIDLLEAIDLNSELRDQMYRCAGSEELMVFLNMKGYQFDVEEFEEAIRLQHVKCQTLEAAQELLHKADWLRYLLLMSDTI
jgi:hypothetical protein